MKKALLLTASLLLTVSAFAQESTQKLMTEGQRAYIAGDLAKAKEKFSLVLEADPKNTAAVNYLRMIRAAEAKNPESKLENQLKTLVLPTVELKDATFISALDYLKQQAQKQSVTVSIVPQVPKEKLETANVTVSLRNIPFLEALRYVCDLASLKFEVQKYAVVIKEKPTGDASPSAQ